jgi:hypothetical protein
MPIVVKGRIMESLQWKESRTSAPLNVRTIALLVCVAIASLLAYGAVAKLSPETISTAIRIAAGEWPGCELTSDGGISCGGDSRSIE